MYCGYCNIVAILHVSNMTLSAVLTPCLQEPEEAHPPIITPLLFPLPLPLAVVAFRVSCLPLVFWAGAGWIILVTAEEDGCHFCHGYD